MQHAEWIATSRALVILLVIASGPSYVNAQSAIPQESNSQTSGQNNAEVLRKIDQLVEQNLQLEKQNRELIDQIKSLRQSLTARPATPPVAQSATEPPVLEQQITIPSALPAMNGAGYDEGEGPGEPDATVANVRGKLEPEHRKFGTYTPNFGFTVADTDKGSINISIFTYARYLNQLDLAPTYTNAFGVTSKVQQRQDFQLNKVQMKFLGWLLSPKFRYFLYAWTSNSNQGQGAQVVLAGNLNYEFSKNFIFSGGITSLPGTRSVEGNFPFWLGEDTRHIADEYFRPSYTSGIFAKGEITSKMRYQAMLGNNLSTLGVNAGQLPNYFSTFSGALVWMPTTGEYGSGFGDFEQHEKLATRLAIHFTRSRESKQAQPNTEAFQNTQLRLSDGSVIFTPNLFAPGTTINDATYRMMALDGGVKLHGVELWGEYYLRWLGDFNATSTVGLPSGLFDHGFQAQVSSMVIPKTLQFYAGGSTIFGQYGTPFDSRIGVNYFPWKNRVVRWNTEALYLYRSPVGYSAVPFVVGGKGWVFHTNMELAF
jgi:hypothetical protein